MRQYDAVRDLDAQVNMVPALGTVEKSKITEYKDILAYIIFKKPAKIRIIGLYPVVRTKAFELIKSVLAATRGQFSVEETARIARIAGLFGIGRGPATTRRLTVLPASEKDTQAKAS